MFQKTYPGDLTEEEYTLIKDLIPQAKSGGRPRTTNILRVPNGIFYVLKSGCQWRVLPKDFPPWGTVYYYYQEWEKQSVFTKIYRDLYPQVRKLHGKSDPQIGIIDSQTVKGAEIRQVKGFRGNKKNQRN